MIEILALIGGLGMVISAYLQMAGAALAARRPPSTQFRILRLTAAVTTGWARRLPRRIGNYVLDSFAPVWLFLTTTAWLCLFLLGVGLLGVFADLVADHVPPVRQPDLGRPMCVLVAGAALAPLIGVAVVAVFFHLATYLRAYRRREREVVRIAAELTEFRDPDLLVVSCLHPAAGNRADRLLAEWTDWLTDLQESHAHCPALIYATSRSTLTWPRAAVAVLDAAALLRAVAPSNTPPQVLVLLAAGARCLQEIAWMAGAAPGGAPVSLEYREERPFSDSVRLVVGAGVHEERERQDTWAEFQRMRSAYAPYATALECRLPTRAG